MTDADQSQADSVEEIREQILYAGSDSYYYGGKDGLYPNFAVAIDTLIARTRAETLADTRLLHDTFGCIHEQRIRELEALLHPFAKLLDPSMEHRPEDADVWAFNDNAITYGDIRRASAALASQQEKRKVTGYGPSPLHPDEGVER